MHQVVIELTNNLKEAYQIFKPEENQSKRASFEVKKTKDKIQLIIKAQDQVALRAMKTSINRLLKIFEQVKNGRTS